MEKVTEVRTVSSLPPLCRDCHKQGLDVAECRVRQYSFKLFDKKCPKEELQPQENRIKGNKDILSTNIRMAELELGIFSPRKVFSQIYIDELAESIEREGQLKPILVRPHPSKPDCWQVIDGEHRIRALEKLGRTIVRVEAHALSDEEADILAMRVNEMHGKRLEALEEGLHVKKLMDTYHLTETEVGERLGRSQQWVSQRLRLVKDASEALLDAFTTRVVNVSKTREIVELPKEDQPAVVAKVAKDKLSFKKTEALVHAIKDHPEKVKEILSKPVEVPVSLPKEIQRAIETSPEAPLFSEWTCPHCHTVYIVNWLTQKIGPKPEA